MMIPYDTLPDSTNSGHDFAGHSRLNEDTRSAVLDWFWMIKIDLDWFWIIEMALDGFWRIRVVLAFDRLDMLAQNQAQKCTGQK